MSRQALPQVVNEALHLPSNLATSSSIVVGSSAWFAWLAEAGHTAFSVATTSGAVTVRLEAKGTGTYWYAYHRTGPKLRKAYLGKTAELTLERLYSVVAELTRPAVAVVATTPATPTTELRLLGAPEILQGDQPLPFASSKALAVLAYLAASDAAQPRDALLALLWPESSEEAARKNLRNALWTIRSTLGAAVLLVQGDRLGLQQGVRSDVRTFAQALTRLADLDAEALAATLALYRGNLLDGLVVLDAPEFELWLFAERERLHGHYGRLADELFARLRAANDWQHLEPIAARVLHHDPLHEGASRALIEALARRGERGAALRAYERLRATLDRELGVAPGPETEALHTVIMQHAAPPAAELRPALPRPAAALRDKPFVGRAAEWAALDHEVAALQEGTARVVVLSGELGIGKSHLWQAWSASSGVASLIEMPCLAATESLPFGPLISLFSHAAWTARVAQAVGAALPPWLSEIMRLLPSLQELLPRRLLGGLSPSDERQRLFEAFVQALLAVTDAPRLLFVDDLHWADSTTLDWLDYCLHRLRDTPLLLLVAYRTEDATPDLLRRIAQWQRDGALRRLPLRRLDLTESGALLQALGRSPADDEQLVQQSAGNPFFLTELAQAPPQSLPVALGDLIRARIDRLPEATQGLLQAGAVLNPDLDLPTLRQLSGQDEETALDALDALLASGMLLEHEERYSFSHPLIATVVHESLSRARRVALHRRATLVLADHYADQLPVYAARLASHARAAGDRAQAGRYAQLAGDHAMSIAAPAEAAAFYRQALASEPTAPRFLHLGRALMWHGQQNEARTALHEAYRRFEAQGEPQGAALALMTLADLALGQGRYTEAGDLGAQALALAGKLDPFIAAAAHVLIGTGARAGGDLATADQHIAQAIALATSHELPEVQLYGAVALSNIRAEQGDAQGALAAAYDMVRLAGQVGNAFYEVVGHNNIAYRALLLGQFEAAREHVETGLRLVAAQGLELPRQWLYSTRGELALAEGAWSEAEHWLERALAEATRHGNSSQAAMIQASLGRAAQGQGNLAAALLLLREARNASEGAAARFQQLQIDLWLAEAHSRSGEQATAQSLWEQAATLVQAGGFHQLDQQVAATRAVLDAAQQQ